MPYADGRVFHDADSHVMEPLDRRAPSFGADLFAGFTSPSDPGDRFQKQRSASRARRNESDAQAHNPALADAGKRAEEIMGIS